MPTEMVVTLVQALNKAVCDCSGTQCNPHINDLALCRTILFMLAEGQPVPVHRLAEKIGQPVTEISKLIEQSTNVERDEAGSIVGVGLTLRPTQHQVRMKGQTFYTWCALDTLMYVPLFHERAEVTSPCAATGDSIQVMLDPSRVVSVTPASAVVSIVVPAHRANIRQNFCNQVHFFSSPEVASTWLTQHPGSVILSVEETFELGQLLTAPHRLSNGTGAIL